ncbi:MAG: MOSC domain-containing protein [Paracoccaceae bacterium]|nr:MOSC domain-containing protein [Paracoccaceae bacterium]
MFLELIVKAKILQNIHELIARHAQNGTVSWIGVRSQRRAAVLPVSRVEVTRNGLAGDHGASEKRAVTMMQREHLAAIGAMLGRGEVAAADLRRNLVIERINLAALKGKRVQIGDVVLELTGICAPCSRMEEILGHGGYSAMRGHGGWCARVLEPGYLDVGDMVVPL